MEKKIARAIKLYPIYYGLQADLLFYIAIDTLFLVTVKNFTEAQIILLTTISTGAGIIFRFPVLWLVRKLGNTTTIRIGSLCMLLSAVLITVGPGYWIVALGRCFRCVAQISNEIALALALENNLEAMGKPADFIKYRTKGNTSYASITLVIALVATYLFNFNRYLPMICCVGCAFTGFVLSFFIGDFTDSNKDHIEQKREKAELRIEKYALIAIVAYGLAYSASVNGIGDAKLFIQQNMVKLFSIEMTANIVGGIYFLSRIGRLFSNIVFVRLYNRFRLKTGVFLTGTLAGAFLSMLLGASVPFLPIKIVMMGLGYILMLFCCDPIRHYTQQIFVVYAPKEQHQYLFANMGLATSICGLVIGTLFSVVLLRFTMNSIMFILLSIGVVATVLMCMLYRQLRRR